MRVQTLQTRTNPHILNLYQNCTSTARYDPVMPRRDRMPQLRWFAQRNRWRATFGSKTIYYSSDESDSRERYEKDLAAYLAAGREQRRKPRVCDLVNAVNDWAAETYPVGPCQNSEANMIRHTLAFLNATVTVQMPMEPSREVNIWMMDADQFGPLHLAAIQNRMIKVGRARSYINHTTRRIKLAWRTAVVPLGLVEPEVAANLDMCPNVRSGRAGVHDPPPVQPVPEEHYEAVLPLLSPRMCAIVQTCRITGMRISEVLKMRVSMIDTSDDAWVYDLAYDHKTGKRTRTPKLVFLGPQAQQVLEPWLHAAMETREMHAALWPSYGKTGVVVRSCVRRAIVDACERAGIPEWTTHRLRHSRATEAFETAARDAVKAVTGHASDSAADRYTVKDSLARELALKHG